MKAAEPSRKVPQSDVLMGDMKPSPGFKTPGANPPAKPPSHGAEGVGGEGTPGSVGGGPGTVRPPVRGY